MAIHHLLEDITRLANPARAAISQRFFKTGPGHYGEGDIFLGLTMPQVRAVVKKYASDLTLDDVDTLLDDKHHEIRMAGVLALVHFARKKTYPQSEVAGFYMDHVAGINNWDLIDVSSEHVIGPYLQHGLSHEERVKFIDTCIASPNIWINRIIVLASFHQIKQGNEKLTFYIAERMLDHPHDLLHKPLGWMLREVGKRCSMAELRGFLDQYALRMPRTMLRYAIEKMDDRERKKYLTMK